MEVVCSSETLLTIYNITLYHNPEDHKLNVRRRWSPKSHTVKPWLWNEVDSFTEVTSSVRDMWKYRYVQRNYSFGIKKEINFAESINLTEIFNSRFTFQTFLDIWMCTFTSEFQNRRLFVILRDLIIFCVHNFLRAICQYYVQILVQSNALRETDRQQH
jgi:hypothetical protein